MSELLGCVEIEPEIPARAAVIWMHGLGADGHDFEPIVPELNLPTELGVRFIFPHAPSIPITINGGMVMPAWYDIRSMELNKRHDEAGVRQSGLAIGALIQREIQRGVPAERIVLAGFSQGGALASFVALRHPERLAGLVVLSAYLVCEESLQFERSPANHALRVFQAHGSKDPMVTPDRGQAARENLEALGHPLEWHSYPMQHEVCLPEIRVLGSWLADVLGSEGS
jgi:phospholipase/carboxylesterase